jgi:arsenic resistance protein ArsH
VSSTDPPRFLVLCGSLRERCYMAQIDWIPLNLGAVRPTQGKTLAVMEVSGGSHSA